ncbi:MAG: DUF4340 domain-containing protein [Gammaproteobacteria bacterium]|nr:DUF4340 domain-containing protein [Gammaproteobacteria bacterium]
MGSRTLLNLGLLLALALLVLLVIFEPGREPDTGPSPLTALGIADIHRIQLARGEETPRLLYREGEHWYLDGNPPLEAETAQVRQLLRLAREPAQRRYAATNLDLARIGLGPDAHRVIFNDEVELRFGTTDPLDGLRYVQRDGEISLVRDFYQHLVEANAEHWVSRRLLPGGQAIVALELPELKLHRDAEGRWQLQPEQPDIGSDAIIALLERWRHANALRVERSEVREPGLWVRVRLEGQETPVEFQLRQVGDDWRFLRTDLGLEYRVADHTTRQLLRLSPAVNETTP